MLNNIILENKIINYILEENIDDVLPFIADINHKQYVIEINDKINKNIKDLTFQFNLMINDYIDNIQKQENPIKYFAIKYSKYPLFSHIIKLIRNNNLTTDKEEIYNIVKIYILNKTEQLKLAKEYIQSI